MVDAQKHKITVTIQEGLVQIKVISSALRNTNDEEILASVSNEKKILQIKDGEILLNDLFSEHMVDKITEMIEQNNESL